VFNGRRCLVRQFDKGARVQAIREDGKTARLALGRAVENGLESSCTNQLAERVARRRQAKLQREGSPVVFQDRLIELTTGSTRFQCNK